MINLGPSWGGGPHNHSPGPPPRAFGSCQSWGAGNVERRMAQASGFYWGSRRVLWVPTLAFLEARTLVPGSQGLLVGRKAAVQSFFTADPLRPLALGGVALGFSFGLRGCRSIPPAQPRVGALAPRSGSGMIWAARGPLLKSWDPTRRSAAPREPRLCAHRHPPPSCSG